MRQFCPISSLGGSPSLSVWFCHKNTCQKEKLIEGVFAASLHTRPDFDPLIYMRIFPQVKPIGKSSISVCLLSRTALSYSGAVCSLGALVMTKWSCALTRLQADCFGYIFLLLGQWPIWFLAPLPGFIYLARIGNTTSIWGGIACGILLDIIVKILGFRKILNLRKTARSFFVEHRRKIDAKASFDGKGSAVMKWRRADEESRIWKLV